MTICRAAFLCVLLSSISLAETTRTWVQTKYDEFEKGTTHGIAINSEGTLTLAPAFSALTTTPSTYIWDLAADANGNVYAAAGSPARVYRIGPDGKTTIIFAPQELQVQTIAIDSSGIIYAATSPDGKVYKILHGGPTPGQAPEGTHTTAEVAAAQEGTKQPAQGGKPVTSVAVDSSYSSSIFFDPKSKYIWALAIDKQGQLYVGTGDQGQIFRVKPDGTGDLFFKSDEAQIRALGFDAKGNLIAGTDGSGLVYRITQQGEGFVLYSAPKKEITALAVDTAGNIYAAGAGEKRGQGAPVGAVPGGAQNALAIIALNQQNPGQQQGPTPSLLPVPAIANLGGSEIYRISPDGSPKTVWSSKEDLVYAFGFDNAGRLLAGTGNKGKIYVIGDRQYTDMVKASANQVTAFAKAPKGGLYAATSNLGKVFLLGANPAGEGTYESDVFDAKIFSQWGRMQYRGTGGVQLFARSGNVDNPDRNWSAWKAVDLKRELPVDAPSARFIQWRAVLRPGNPAPTIDSVTLNYLPKNVAPEVDDVTVSVGARVPSGTRALSIPADSTGYEAPTTIPTVPDRRAIAVRWKARDANDDDLLYSVYFRGDGETRWKLLRDGVENRYINLESDLFPDGGYTILVVASDASSHATPEALTGEATSARFEVDNTPPHVSGLTAKAAGGDVHVAFKAVDSFSNISRAEYSIDAEDWQIADPVGQISDYTSENYDFTVPLPAASSPSTATNASGSSMKSRGGNADEHVIIVRVYDGFDNVGVAKATFVAPPATTTK